MKVKDLDNTRLDITLESHLNIVPFRMLTAEIPIILFAGKEVESAITVLIDMTNDLTFELIEHSLGVVSILPLDYTVFISVGEYNTKKVV